MDELDDRDRSIYLGRILSIFRKGWEDVIREQPQPLTLSDVFHHRRPHRDPTEGDVWMRSKVVIPGWVMGVAGVGCGDRHPVTVVKVDDGVASARAASCATGLEQRSRKDKCRGKAAAG